MPLTGAFILPHPPIILPEVGRGEEQKIRKTTQSYEKAAAMIAELKPDTIVLTSPHSPMYLDYFHISPGESASGDMERFKTKNVAVNVTYDIQLRAEIEKEAEKEGLPAGGMGGKDAVLDHGTLIPLYFVNKQYKDYKLIRIGLSGLPFSAHYELGKCIGRAIEKSGKRVVFIASGDLSHKVAAEGPYGYSEAGVRFDREICAAMAMGDFGRILSFSPDFADEAAECGLRSILIMAGALDGRAVKADFLSYEGTFGVGYGVACYTPAENDDSRKYLDVYNAEMAKKLQKTRDSEDAYVALARKSVESYVTLGRITGIPDALPGELKETRAGAFVSLHLHGDLRGCIGTIEATRDTLAEEIIYNAVSACSRDPRFKPVKTSELAALEYSVDVLGAPESATSSMLDHKKYGVIVTRGRKRGLLLPDLESVDSVERQIEIALSKAGIEDEEGYKLERFTVTRHK